MEITLNELADLPEGTYTMADVRSELSYSYGTIPKAVSMPDIVQKAKNGELMGILWGAQVQTMMPKLHSTNFEGMELIRPMYLIREDDIKAWRDYNNLHFIQCARHFTGTYSSCREDGVPVSKRMATKQLIKEMKTTNPCVESNIFNSVCNVNLDTIISYKEKRHFA